MLDDTKRTCDLYRKAIDAGEDAGDVVGQLARMCGVQRPAIWKRLRAGGVLPAYKTKGPPKVHPVRPSAASRMTGEQISALQVDRDACPRCGVRRDFGCGHSGAPLGTSF